MKCEFCGADLPYDVNQCPACGAPCERIASPKRPMQVSGEDSDAEQESSHPSAVKKFSSVDVSFLKNSEGNSAAEDELEEVLLSAEENIDEDYEDAKKGYVILAGIVLLFLIVGIIFFMCQCG